jgi:hypothetical protein
VIVDPDDLWEALEQEFFDERQLIQMRSLLPAARLELDQEHYIESFSAAAALLRTISQQCTPGFWQWHQYGALGRTLAWQPNANVHESNVLKTTDDWPATPADEALIQVMSSAAMAQAVAGLFAEAVEQLRQHALDVDTGTDEAERAVSASLLSRCPLAQQALPLLRALVMKETQ